MSNSIPTDLRVIVGLARRVASLAPTRRDAAKNWLATFHVWAGDRGWTQIRTWPTVEVAHCGREARIAVASRCEVEVVNEVFCEQQYRVDGLDRTDLILDLGSNVGASIAYFRARYPRARIIGLEPDPNAYQRLKASVSTLANVEVYPWAIADIAGSSRFHSAPQSWESAILPTDAPADGSIDVETISLPGLMERLDIFHVDLVKMDVEGAEWLVFSDPSAFARCDAIVGELHFDRPDQTPARAEEALRDFEVLVTSRSGTRANFIAHRKS